MLKNLVLAIFITIFSTSYSHSSVFVEPVLGYTKGTFDIREVKIFSPSVQRDFDVEGFSYGLRAGYEFSNFQLGADYIINHLRASKSDVIIDDKSFKTSDFSAFLGYRFWHLRAYGGYIINTKVHDSDIKDGNGFKLGLSFYAKSNIAISLEYKDVDFSEFLSTDTDLETVSLLVSFPFSL